MTFHLRQGDRRSWHMARPEAGWPSPLPVPANDHRGRWLARLARGGHPGLGSTERVLLASARIAGLLLAVALVVETLP